MFETSRLYQTHSVFYIYNIYKQISLKDFLYVTVFQVERKSADKNKCDNPQETKTDQLAVSDVDDKTNDSDQLSLVRKRGWPKGVPRGPKNTTRKGRSANRGRAKPKVSSLPVAVVEPKLSSIHTELSLSWVRRFLDYLRTHKQIL